ncbi:hypothetical protein P175DRAFT_0496814 [Aspergillus ochraceoroseus IBT 24754]|uniref:PA14 domain-containing protein n=1 Tax=Aspergillus ochraceoroseus IBT 24754 TaxID=1392256 RepID=A0A2T5M563_9EURO|nr:uncharacterized protein P175DRAFT_0496814 [Aspergillus ochraceoroseus IBT 24754]PTU23654.1 hypothetical protein P175DRAFT_0496814 [Aspergillus ochraceoroseus IBT 24754]
MSTQSNHCPTVPPITIIVPTATAEPCTCIEGEYTTVIDTVTVAPEGISRTTTTPTHIVTATETWVHPTPTSYNGLNYYQYINDYDYFNSPNGFGGGDYDTANWNGNYSYSTSGLTRNIDFESPNWPSGPARCQLPGQDTATDCSQWTVVFQGFLYAAEAGNYTVHAPTSSESSEWQDNSGFWWGGEKAYSSYANENVDGGATGNGIPGTPNSFNYPLMAGEFLPMTFIYSNGGGPAANRISITSPNGTRYPADLDLFVPPCPNSPFIP